MNPPGCRVAVLGAGISGLSAAIRLHNLGHEPIVFEARNRIGGRILSVRLAGWPGVVEVGARYVGRCHHRIQRLCSRYGALLEAEPPTTRDSIIPDRIMFRGHEMNRRELVALEREYHLLFKAIEEQAARRAKAAGRPDIVECVDQPLKEFLLNLGASDAAVEFFTDIDSSRQTAQTLLAAVNAAGSGYFENVEALTARSGLSSIVEGCVNQVGRNRIFLEHEAVSIKSHGSGVAIEFSDTHGTLKMEHFDGAVLAVPPESAKALLSGLDFEFSVPSLAQHRYIYFLFSDTPHDMVASYLSDEGMIRTAVSSAHDNLCLVDTLCWDTEADLSDIEKEVRRALRIGQATLIDTLECGWTQDPRSGGTYAYEGLKDPIVTWKGSEIPIFLCGDWLGWPYIGFMEGAVLSGERAAEMVAQKMRVFKNLDVN